MKYSLNLGKIAGIRLSIHWTFAILLVYVIFSTMNQGTSQTIWMVLFTLAIFACVVLHELGHALAARRYGIPTRSITLLPIGGVASLERIPEKPSEELVVALAGPLVNLLIMLVLIPFVKFPASTDELTELAAINQSTFLINLLAINGWLALFNLIPAFPMDGGRVLRALLSFRMERARATRIAASIGQFLAIGFVILGFFGNPFLVFIGLFIFLGAQQETTHVQTSAAFQGHTVSEVSMSTYPTLHQSDLVQDAVQLLLDSQNRNFLIVDTFKEPVGTLSRETLIKGLAERGNAAFLSDVMDPDILYLDATLPLQEAWQLMQTQKKSFALVRSNGQIVGALDPENVVEFLMVQQAVLGKNVAGRGTF
ncbi:site-2 protease family protein [Rhabdobacter roseus]|uniref:Zinc metalloprotease n=1 Tax=Rhabdobacter roseus TaxID=1655419 RepID=A0A840TLJ5_9BACT|nr:site-2 protease family protein [Rhabdobacter roseus]MBB5282432.1 Zn-dependent protease [Rhabdobacter roseus]